MQVQSGEVFGFLGPERRGQKHHYQIADGDYFPTAGTAQILGKAVSDVSMHRDIGYLPEQPYFYDYLTAAEVLDYFGRFHGFSAAERGERVQKMLKNGGIGDRRENSAAEIFQGNVAACRPGAGDLARSKAGHLG